MRKSVLLEILRLCFFGVCGPGSSKNELGSIIYGVRADQVESVLQAEDRLRVHLEPIYGERTLGSFNRAELQTMLTEVIEEDAEYEGVRAKLVATLEQARIRMQIDGGCGDAVQPGPRTSEFLTVLKQIDPPLPRMYPPEVIVAERLHAKVVLDIRNSRIKDFYDLWYLART